MRRRPGWHCRLRQPSTLPWRTASSCPSARARCRRGSGSRRPARDDNVAGTLGRRQPRSNIVEGYRHRVRMRGRGADSIVRAHHPDGTQSSDGVPHRAVGVGDVVGGGHRIELFAATASVKSRRQSARLLLHCTTHSVSVDRRGCCHDALGSARHANAHKHEARKCRSYCSRCCKPASIRRKDQGAAAVSEHVDNL